MLHEPSSLKSRGKAKRGAGSPEKALFIARFPEFLAVTLGFRVGSAFAINEKFVKNPPRILNPIRLLVEGAKEKLGT